MSERDLSVARRIRSLAWILMLALSACEMLQSPKPYSSDRMIVAEDYRDRLPGSVAVFPVESVDSLDFQGKDALREDVYNLLLEKGYAPLALTFTDRTLRDLGKFHAPLCPEQKWNIEPLKGVLVDYADALVLISVEHYLESGQPDKSGIQIWGKAGVFDSRTGEMLYEHYTRQTLHPSDPGGGRELYIQKAIGEFAELLLKGLPEKKRR